RRIRAHFSGFPQHGSPERLRRAFERLGPTFIKLGQLLSLRPDLAPPEYCEEFKKLQDHCEPLPYEAVSAVIEQELGKPPAALFRTFSREPLSTASIAQVHRATLKNNTPVVVKVQRPGIHDLIARDIRVMYHIAHLLEKHHSLKHFHPAGIVEEFERYTKNELDFLVEAQNMKRFAGNFSEVPSILIPVVYDALTTSHVLTMQYLEGISIEDPEALRKKKIDLRKIARIGYHALLQQVFEDGFFHADPHPGNLLIISPNRLAFCDFGIVGELSDELRHHLILLLTAVLNRDVEGILEFVDSVCTLPPDCDMPALQRDMSALLAEWYGKPLDDVHFSLFIYRILHTLINYHIQVPPNLILFTKALLTMEGTGLALDPDFNIIHETKPYLRRIILSEYNPKTIAKKLFSQVKSTEELVFTLPKTAHSILQKIEKGELKMQFDTRVFRQLEEERHYDSMKSMMATLLAALLISSAVLAQAPEAPTLFGYSLAHLGFLTAGILSLFLVLMIVHPKYP
ncbi:hypothetical protein COY95_00080, partial [Candidatus Woesearchaeota archaeon CG_4_10_14_0_8_um_filter_47_5]